MVVVTPLIKVLVFNFSEVNLWPTSATDSRAVEWPVFVYEDFQVFFIFINYFLLFESTKKTEVLGLNIHYPITTNKQI